MNNCAILVIYCNIFFIYVFLEVTEVHVPHSEVQLSGGTFMRRKDVGGLTAMLECKSTCCYVLWPLEGSRRASQFAYLCQMSNAVTDRNQQERVFSVLLAVMNV